MSSAHAVSLLLSASLAAAPPEPPELSAIRARYQRVLDATKEGDPVDSARWSPLKDGQETGLELYGADLAQDDGDRKQLAFARVQTQWSNLGKHKAEYLYGPDGELTFFYAAGDKGAGNAVELRLYFVKGALTRVMEKKKVLDAPTAKHQVAAERAQKEARRLAALFRELQATVYEVP